MRRRLAEVRAKIESGGGGGGSSITDKNFEDALREVETFVEKLYRASLDSSSPSSGAVARFRDFQNALLEIQRKLQEIVNRRISIGDQKNTGQRQVEDAKATIDRIENLMKQLDDLLRNQGRDAVDEAKRAEQVRRFASKSYFVLKRKKNIKKTEDKIDSIEKTKYVR